MNSSILVEGQDDLAVIVGNLKTLHPAAPYSETTFPRQNRGDKNKPKEGFKGEFQISSRTISIYECGGRDELVSVLRALALQNLENLAIIFDSDGNERETLIKLQNNLREANLGIPTETNSFTASTPKVGIMLMKPFDLESVIWQVLKDNYKSLTSCVDDYFSCLELLEDENGKPIIIEKNKYKTLVKAYFAARPSKRGRIELSIKGAVSEGLIDFNHPIFSDLKSFLQQL